MFQYTYFKQCNIAFLVAPTYISAKIAKEYSLSVIWIIGMWENSIDPGYLQ